MMFQHWAPQKSSKIPGTSGDLRCSADRPRWTWLRRNWISNLACRWADSWHSELGRVKRRSGEAMQKPLPNAISFKTNLTDGWFFNIFQLITVISFWLNDDFWKFLGGEKPLKPSTRFWFWPRNATWNWHQFTLFVFCWGIQYVVNHQPPKTDVWFTSSHHCSQQALFGVRIRLWCAGVHHPGVWVGRLLTCGI